MLDYLIRQPSTIQSKNPALILLHGYGSDANDLFSFAPELPENYYIISVQAPYSLHPYGYAWYAINFDADQNKFSDTQQAIQSRNLIISFIDEITQKFPIDPQNITLAGFSQGAILSLAIALSYPEKIKRVAALSGYLNTDIIDPNYSTNNFQNSSFYISHGSQDQVIPVSWARKTKPFLDALHINTIYLEYPVGHGVAPKNFMDFKNWLLS